MSIFINIATANQQRTNFHYEACKVTEIKTGFMKTSKT